MLFGKYQLLECLAHSRLVDVYLGQSFGAEGFAKQLVVKQLRPEILTHPGAEESFLAGVRTAMALTQANIVQVFDTGKIGDTYFIAEEYVHGCDCATLLRAAEATDQPLSLESALFLTTELAAGLAYAHGTAVPGGETGACHGDLAPAHVLISFAAEVKIADFALGRLAALRTAGAPDSPPDATLDRARDVAALGALAASAALNTPHRPPSDPDVLDRALEARRWPKSLRTLVRDAMVPDSDIVSAAALHDALLDEALHHGIRVSRQALQTDVDRLAEVLRSQRAARRTSLAPNGPTQSPEDTPTDPVAAQRIDVALLAVPTARAWRKDKAAEVAAAFGGVPLETHGDTAVWLFGVPPVAKPLSAAAAAAWETTRALDIPVAVTAIPAVCRDGSVREDTALRDAVETVGNLAQTAASRRAPSVLAPANHWPLVFDDDWEVTSREGSDTLAPRPWDAPGDAKFVGRIEPLTTIGHRLETVSQGAAHAVSLVGAPGMGKTRLMREVYRRLIKAGHRFAWHAVTCRQADTDRPCSTAIRLLRSLTLRFEDWRACGVSDVLAATLSADPEAPIEDAVDVAAVSRAFVAGMHRVADTAPVTVLLVDDAAFLDEDSRRVLHHVALDLRHDPILLVMALWPGVHSGFEHGEDHTEISLGPLDADAVATLVTSACGVRCDLDTTDRLCAHVHGNPGMVLAYARQWQRDGALAPSAKAATLASTASWLPGPEVRCWVGAAVQRLSPAARAAAVCLSLTDDPVPTDVLGACIRSWDADPQAAVDELCARGLAVRLTDEEVTMGAAVYRAVTYASLPRAERCRWHARLADALERVIPEDHLVQTWHRLLGPPAAFQPDDYWAALTALVDQGLWNDAVSYTLAFADLAADRPRLVHADRDSWTAAVGWLDRHAGLLATEDRARRITAVPLQDGADDPAPWSQMAALRRALATGRAVSSDLLDHPAVAAERWLWEGDLRRALRAFTDAQQRAATASLRHLYGANRALVAALSGADDDWSPGEEDRDAPLVAAGIRGVQAVRRALDAPAENGGTARTVAPFWAAWRHFLSAVQAVKNDDPKAAASQAERAGQHAAAIHWTPLERLSALTATYVEALRFTRGPAHDALDAATHGGTTTWERTWARVLWAALLERTKGGFRARRAAKAATAAVDASGCALLGSILRKP